MLPYDPPPTMTPQRTANRSGDTPVSPEPLQSPHLPEKFLTNLRDSIIWSRRQIMPGIQKRLDILRQIVGRHYGSGGARERVPMNFLRMQTSILSRHLVSRSPRMLIETDDPTLRPTAHKFQKWAANRFDAMALEDTLHSWALEAIIYPVAIVKVCSGLGMGHDGFPDYGEPYLDNVDPERAVWDMAAKSWKQLDYIGHRYTVAKEVMMQPGSGYDQARVKDLRPDPYLQMNELGVEKTETMSQDSSFNYNRLREYIDVFEVYLPKEGLIVHLPVIGNQIDSRPIMVEPYIGMVGPFRTGPFHIAFYDKVPGNLMASPPVHAIYDLHEAINRMARKTIRQSDRQKTNLLVQSTMTEDATKVKNAGDGDIIPVSHPEAFKENRLGGPDQQNMAFMLNLKQTLSWFGGNFDALGGLGPQSDTATQDKLLSAASSGLVQFMQQQFYTCTTGVMRSMLWYEWNSRRTQEVNLPIRGTAKTLTTHVQPHERGIDEFFYMKFQVHPYSMQPVSPQQRIKQWMQLFQGIIAPSMGLMQQAGASFDIVNFVKKIAEYQGLTDLDDVLKVHEMTTDPEVGGGGTEGARVRPEGTGQYTRTNVGPTGQAGQDEQVMEMMRAAPQTTSNRSRS